MSAVPEGQPTQLIEPAMADVPGAHGWHLLQQIDQLQSRNWLDIVVHCVKVNAAVLQRCVYLSAGRARLLLIDDDFQRDVFFRGYVGPLRWAQCSTRFWSCRLLTYGADCAYCAPAYLAVGQLQAIRFSVRSRNTGESRRFPRSVKFLGELIEPKPFGLALVMRACGHGKLARERGHRACGRA
jgi:hypothetical protein